MKVVLAINAGSSSVKISVYIVAGPGANPVLVADAQVSGLTAPPSKLAYRRRQRQRSSNPDASEKENEDDTVTVQKDQLVDVQSQSQGQGQGQDQSHNQSQQSAAFKLLLDTLTSDPHLEEIASADDVAIACHRIVHGGDYQAAQLITKETYHHLETLSDLAPLHNGAALDIVDACLKALPAAANVACFDSQFHTSIPPHICTYPIRQDVAHKNRLRKYGFHGISYSFITRSVADFLERDPGTLNIIALHLGSGASACAVRNGQSWDTSMGLTPLAGLPGATRSGSIDPSLVFHYASDVGKLSPASTANLHISKAEEILNKRSGWSALTGTTDFGAIASSDDPRHKLAFDIFVDRVSAFVGSYFVSLEGQVDALVFAGGIGEKSAPLRRAVTQKVQCLGFALDEEKNEALGSTQKNHVVADVTGTTNQQVTETARPKVLVCQTNEQFEMAKTCADMSDLWNRP